jgi:hypothetical protein
MSEQFLPPGDREVDPGEITPVEDMSEAWQAAFNRAVHRGCTEKAARLYADAHEGDWEKAPAPAEDKPTKSGRGKAS